MEEIPLAQFEEAFATYCTLVLTLLPLAGAETETPAKAKDPELNARRRANFLTGKLRPQGLQSWSLR